jgi:D-threo-aldose 1-dehydrogenase
MRHSQIVEIKGGAKVSQLGLGTAQLGGLYSSVSESDGQELIDTAITSGITYFDTAPHYGKGVSERRLGGYLSQYPRDSWVLSSKVGRLLVPTGKENDSFFLDADNSVERLNDYSEYGIRKSFEDSLKRLGLESIDIVYIHDPDDFPEEAIKYSYPALEKLRTEGLIKSIGIGMNYNEIPTRLINETDIDVVMNAGRYTLLDQSASIELFPAALRKGVSIVSVGVFNSGVLANPTADSHYFYEPAPAHIVARALEFQGALREYDVTLQQAALQFPLRHAAVKCVVVGCRSSNSLLENIENFDRAIPVEAWEKVDSLISKHRNEDAR